MKLSRLLAIAALPAMAVLGLGSSASAATHAVTPAKPAVHAASINCTDSHWIIDVALPGPNRAFAVVNNATEHNGINANGTGSYGFNVCYNTVTGDWCMQADAVPGPNNWVDAGSLKLVADAGGCGPHEVFRYNCIAGTHNGWILFNLPGGDGVYGVPAPNWETQSAFYEDAFDISGVC